MSASHAAPHQPIHLHFAAPNVTNVMGGWQPPPPPPSSGMAAIAAAAAHSKPPPIRDLLAHGVPQPSQPPSGGAPPLAITLFPDTPQPSALEVLTKGGGRQPPPGPLPGAATAIAAVAEAPRRIQKNDGPYRSPSKPRAKSVPKPKSPAPAPAPAPEPEPAPAPAQSKREASAPRPRSASAKKTRGTSIEICLLYTSPSPRD